ncbi:thioredoxin family protein [Paenibacillus caui]|uniref:thioredoxin family protein n=1 Tax=Paenibacillus caui TaxID=2873927 RepID=UPI001CA83A15|nr:thioredoxin family protein [Paenibacillus caui]
MPLKELSEQELLLRLDHRQEQEGVLLFTPLCGTCQLGERMLDIVEATGKAVPLFKVNINYSPVLRERWRIESVPCLALLKGGELILKEYALRSVDHLFHILRRDKP